MGSPPAPHRHDDVALHPLRPRRLGRDLAGRDAVGPVGEELQRALAPHPVQPAVHARAAAPHLHAVVPGGHGRVEVVDVDHRHLAGRHVAHLVAELTAVLEPVDPLCLVPHAAADAVAVRARARELGLGRHLEQRVPVVGGIDARRLLRRRRRGDVEGQLVAGLRAVLVGVDEAVAADPDQVLGVGQVRHQEAPVVAGDDDLAEGRLEVRRLGDDPDSGLAARGAPDDTTDVAVVGRCRARAGHHRHGEHRQHHSRRTDPGCHTHRTLLGTSTLDQTVGRIVCLPYHLWFDRRVRTVVRQVTGVGPSGRPPQGGNTQRLTSRR